MRLHSPSSQAHYIGKVTLVAVHGHSLGVAAQLAIGRRADGSAAGTTAVRAALLQGEKLLGAEGLVVGL